MWTELSILFATVAFLVYLLKLYMGRHSNFWEKRGILQLQNTLDTFELFTGKRNPFDLDMDNYRELGDNKYGGVVVLGTPYLFVKDLDIAKHIFVKDFDHFMDRRDSGRDPILSDSLVFLQGQKWKDMRAFLSPTFTSGKIRRMFQHFNEGGVRLQNYVTSRCPKSKQGGYDVNVPNLIRKYTVDAIGAAAFGMETNAFTDDNSIFYKMATRTSEVSFIRIVRTLVLFNLPKLGEFLGLTLLDKDVNEFFQAMLSKALKIRKSSSDKNERTDFLQLLVEAKLGSSEIDESELNQFEKEAQVKSSSKAKLQLTEQMAIAQGLLFFVAGFDTVANFLNVTVYLLATQPEMQQKLYEEIDRTKKSSGGQITYEGINGMEYLDKYVSEVLRLYPATQRLERQCTKDYTIPGTNQVIPKGTIIAIGSEGIHTDEKYYKDPLKFDPEKFNAENKAVRNPYAFMPFGIGPRNCIGMRFALIESKVALAHLVHKFMIQPNEKTPIPVKIERQMGAFRIDKELEVRLVPRV